MRWGILFVAVVFGCGPGRPVALNGEVDATMEPGCPASLTNCGGKCVDASGNPDHCGACDNKCGAGNSCVAGSCTCAAGKTECDGVCVDLAGDPYNCGKCGCDCGVNPCNNGSCCDCPSGSCGGDGCGDCGCVDLQTDEDHCGACDNKCDLTQGYICKEGDCRCMWGPCACPAGLTRCDGKCVNTQTDESNCGACAKTCFLGQYCVNGQCG